MHEVVFLDKTKKVAASWDELSRKQLDLLLPILYGKYADANQQRIEVLEVLLGVNRASPATWCRWPAATS